MAQLVPPRAAAMHIDDLAAFDDEGLRTFLDPCDGGVDTSLLGRALQRSDPDFVSRVRSALPAPERSVLDGGLGARVAPAAVDEAAAAVVEQLFWPLLYWNHADEYCELVDGEDAEPALLQLLDLEGATICDIGAGAGRFTFAALERGASSIIAVDAVPALIDLLRDRAARRGVTAVDVRRGCFTALPLGDASVQLAVAYSAFTECGPHGGPRALREAERVTEPGGVVAVLWPQDPEWLVAQGYERTDVDGDTVRHFPDVDAALRLCERFYGEAAVRWVRENGAADVPFEVLGMRPPTIACCRRIDVTPSR